MAAGAEVSALVGAGSAKVGPTLQRTIGDFALISFRSFFLPGLRLPAFQRKKDVKKTAQEPAKQPIVPKLSCSNLLYA